MVVFFAAAVLVLAAGFFAAGLAAGAGAAAGAAQALSSRLASTNKLKVK